MTETIAIARHEFTPEEIAKVEEHLYAYNAAAVGRDDGEWLGFAIPGGDGGFAGAVAGYTWAGYCEIRQLWVDEVHRGKGWGRILLEAAVGEARARGCDRVFLASYSFQAPGLYEKCGFHRVAEIDGWPPGHVNVILRRDLGPTAAP